MFLFISREKKSQMKKYYLMTKKICTLKMYFFKFDAICNNGMMYVLKRLKLNVTITSLYWNSLNSYMNFKQKYQLQKIYFWSSFFLQLLYCFIIYAQTLRHDSGAKLLCKTFYFSTPIALSRLLIILCK